MKLDCAVVSDGTDFIALATRLRRAGVSVATSWNGKIKSQIRRAPECHRMIICEKGRYRIRNLWAGASTEATPDQIAEEFCAD